MKNLKEALAKAEASKKNEAQSVESVMQDTIENFGLAEVFSGIVEYMDNLSGLDPEAYEYFSEADVKKLKADIQALMKRNKVIHQI